MKRHILVYLIAISLIPAKAELPSLQKGATTNSAPQTTENIPAIATDSVELAQMYDEDQSDRRPQESIDWKVVQPRDRAREAMVKELYVAGRLKTGNDYYRAAMVLQHATRPEDFLLAHELCVVAIFKGTDARWLAAASEDRFLRSIGRPQRYGTQSNKIGDSPWSLGDVDALVTDTLRMEMKVPSLEDAKEQLAKRNEMLERAKKPSQQPQPTPAR
ncbi:MAG TPA: hypothetical protein VMC06_07675 [Opitutaceae bacterium]|nr:hypothetical protein [Opitutaceae bacterium]